MTKYLVYVNGCAAIHVNAESEDEAKELVDQLCSDELDYEQYKSLDREEVEAVRTLSNWEIAEVWEDNCSNDPTEQDRNSRN